MKKLYGALLLSIIAFTVGAQVSTNLTGAQILRQARSIYDQGRLHELPVLLERELQGLKFNQSEKIEAYKLLILTYIYLEEPVKADETMIALLNTDHFFRVSPSDPVEFATLYKKFRSRAVYRFGVKAGINNTFINPLKVYYVSAEGAKNGVYKSNMGFHGGGVFEYDLGDKGWKKNFALAPELFYSISSVNYSNTQLFDQNFEQKTATISHDITESRLQLNALVQYKFADDYFKKLVPYASIGPAISYLLNSTLDGSVVFESRDAISRSVDQTDSFKPINVSVVLSAGARFQIGSVYLVGDIRYQHGLMNVVTNKNRFATPDLMYANNDFSINQAMINLGLVVPHFSPKKLVK